MANLFLPQLITWFRLDEHVKRLKGRVDELEANPPTPATPTLQQVTTQGNTTDQNIISSDTVAERFIEARITSVNSSAGLYASGLLKLRNLLGFTTDLGTTNITADRTLELPDESGTLSVNKYNSYAVLFSQTGTSAPTVNIFENSLNILSNWTREAAGQYKLATNVPYDTTKIYLSGFGLRQVITFVDGVGITTGQGIFYFVNNGSGGTDFYFVTLVGGAFVDLSTISPTPIVHLPEIKVYN